MMMALHIHWYDAACFAIVAGAIIASIWLLLLKQHKHRRTQDQHQHQQQHYIYRYESLVTPLISASGSNDDTPAYLAAECLWRSAWRGVHPAVLLILRLGAVVVLTGALLWDLHKYDPSIFVYYTEWTFLLVILYFLIGTVISAHGCWLYYRQKARRDIENGDGNVHNRTALLSGDTNSGPNLKQERAGTWGYCMQIIYQTCGGAVMLTDVVFWCLLAPFMSSAHFSVNLLMGCMHSLNLLFLLVDTLLNSMPFPWFRMAYFILWSCAYVIFQWILHACGFSWWPYPFLELATPWAPFWYFCMALIHVPCYGIYWLIVKAKNTYFPRLFPHSFVALYD